jgi:hypothetical protein
MHLSKSLFTLFFTFLFNTLTQNIYAQRLSQGYIITNKNDTITGFVKYDDWISNPREIVFKKNKQSKAETLSPMSIKEFKVKNERYVSRIVSYSTASSDLLFLSTTVLPPMRLDTVFLGVNIVDRISMYELITPNLYKHYFIESDNQKIEELIQYKHYVENNKMQTDDFYKETLKKFMTNCEAMSSKIDATPFVDKELFKIISYLNKECGGQKPNSVYFKNVRKPRISFGITSGVGISSLSFKGSGYYNYLTLGEHTATPAFNVGLRTEIASAKSFGKWVFSNELLFKSYAHRYVYIDKNASGTGYRRIQSGIGFSTVGANFLAKYKFGLAGFRPFVFAGVHASYQSPSKNVKTDEYVDNNTTTLKVDDLLFIRTVKNETGFIVGVGGQFKRYALDLRYVKGSRMFTGLPITNATSFLFLQAGFNF